MTDAESEMVVEVWQDIERIEGQLKDLRQRLMLAVALPLIATKEDA